MKINQSSKIWGDEKEKMPLVLKPKKGRIIPPRRKLVKKMVFDSIVVSIISFLQTLFSRFKANKACKNRAFPS